MPERGNGQGRDTLAAKNEPESTHSLAQPAAALRVNLPQEIQAEHAAVCRAIGDGLLHARRAGELLSEAKAGLEHGAWLPWLATNVPELSVRSAQGYMRVAARWPEIEARANTQRVAHLRGALALLAEPKNGDDVAGLDVARALERNASTIRRELDLLDLALKSTELSLEQAAHVERRARELEGAAIELRVRAERGLGLLAREVEEAYGPAVAQAMLANPDVFITAANARIQELELAGG